MSWNEIRYICYLVSPWAELDVSEEPDTNHGDYSWVGDFGSDGVVSTGAAWDRAEALNRSD